MRSNGFWFLVLLAALLTTAASCGIQSNGSAMGRQASMVAREGREAGTQQYYRLGPKFEPQLDKMVGQEIMALAVRKEDLPLELNRDDLVNLNYFLNDARGFMTRSLNRGQKYIPMMKAILRQKGLPEELVYLALIESGFRTEAVSSAKAVGPWQFIASTGRNYGLTINKWVDERRDPVKSTYAAADYLTTLHDMFNSWPLAIAAYNSGEGKIQKGMRNPDVDNYWDMAKDGFLAKETKRYVPSFLAVAIIAKDPMAYGLEIESSPPDAWEDVVVPGAIDLEQAARLSGSSFERLKELNPHLTKMTTPPDEANFVLRVPEGTTALFYKQYAQLPVGQRSGGLITYSVKRGETVEQVAARHGLTPEVVRRYNSIEGSKLARGQQLVLPTSMPPELPTVAVAASTSSRPTASPSAAQGSIIQTASGPSSRSAASSTRQPAVVINSISHRVRSGDTILGLARLYGVQAEQIRTDNKLASNNIIEGQVLTIRSNLPLTAATAQKNRDTWVEVSEGVPIYHSVKKGETISSIAANYRLSQNQLKSLNNLKSNSIRAGQRLRIGTGPAPTGADSAGEYVVKSGDTISALAERFKLSSSRLKELNNLSSDRLAVGQKLRVSASASQAASSAASSPASSSSAIYEVKSGDTVSTIAERFSMSSAALRELNNLSNNNIRVGQKLKVSGGVAAAAPPAAAPPVASAAPASAAVASSSAIYEVKSGDTVSTIAERFSMSSAALRELNNLSNNNIRVGQKLKVSGGAAAAAPPAAASAVAAAASEIYVVKSGDTVSTIAERFSMRSAALRELNNLSNDNIWVGQKLKVSGTAPAAMTTESAASVPSPSAPASKPASQPAAPSGSYEVKRGDTISTIAERFSMSSAALRELNNLSNNNIRVGQKLKVSGAAPTAGTTEPAARVQSPPAPASQAAAPSGIYEVKSGDTISTIAERFSMSSAALRELNNLSSDNIRVGQKLKVTGSVQSGSGTSSAATHKVAAGETMTSIARRYGLTIEQLKKLNGQTNSSIQAGQVLKVK
ncbi:MAG: LysM peptidoglycan-binding domain-containing protein [Deltaproteobacteria bacterium]|jgi:membrane-bound lytic murein transglycosylase D|nr:LysM peptidoglycan-binding domain-containing protein [Deltaproteobacteria bacterium]